MTDRHRRSRRTVLRTLGTLGAATLVASGTGSARDRGETEGRCGPPQTPSPRRAAPPRSDAGGADSPVGTPRDATDIDDPPAGATRYVAVVDRIVDGEHVVLLLEEDGELVDQHVASVDEFDDIGEGDILIAVVGDELLAYRHVPERP